MEQEGISREGRAEEQADATGWKATRQQAELMNLAQDAIIILTQENRIVFWNRSCEILYGWRKGEAVGQIARDLLRTRFPDTLDVVYEVLRATGRWQGELIHTRRDGSPVVVSSTWSLLEQDRAGDPRAILEVNRDITERTRAEEERRHLLTSARCLLWSSDVAAQKDGVLTWTMRHFDEEAAERLVPLRAPKGEPYIWAWHAARLPEDRERSYRIGDECVRAGQDFEQEFRMRSDDGSLHWLREAVRVETVEPGKCWRLVGVCTDITAERQAQERLAKAFSASPNALVISRESDGLIRDANERFLELFGLERGATVGRRSTDLGMFADPAARPSAMELLNREGRIQNFETVIRSHSGEERTVRLSVERIETEEEPSLLTVMEDVTEQNRAQAQMRQMEAEARSRTVMLETANHVALDILTSRTGVEALHHIAEAARLLSGARYAALGVARPGTEELMEFVTTGLSPEEEVRIGPRPKGRGVLGLLLRERKPLRIDTLSEHPASVRFPENHPPMKSFLGVPITQGETILGSLYLTDKQGGGPFTEADEVAVQALGAHAAIAIHNLHVLLRERAMVGGLIAAQEEERRAVAYDLHDGLTQFVMASQAHFEAFRRAHTSGKQERAERELEQGMRFLKEAVVESRRLVNGLRTLALDDLGVAGALEQLLNEEKARAGWQEVEFLHNIAGRRFDQMLETAVYRVAQEALTNARKYAQTARVAMRLLTSAEAHTGHPQLVLQIRDWGKGFQPEEKLKEHGRVGLHSMRERVLLLGGTYTLQSAPGAGTHIQAVFPVLPVAPAENPGSSESEADGG